MGFKNSEYAMEFSFGESEEEEKEDYTSFSLNTIGLDYPHSKMHD